MHDDPDDPDEARAPGGVPSLATLLQLGDLDALVREVDRLAGVEDWDALLVLRERCHAAAEEVGKQLWGPAQYAEYRLALDAPGPLAARVVAPGAARFALGPLTEVLAQRHAFEEVADHLDPISAAVVAQERALRGEDLAGDPRASEEDTGVPARLQPWEPAYALPSYGATQLVEGTPVVRPGTPVAVDAPPGRPRALPEVARALAELVAPWEATSAGEVHVATVEGDAAAAVAAVSAVPAVLLPVLLPVRIGDALAAMAWAAASGGALGRRRGGAAGRAAAWWVGCAVTGLGVPVDPDELEYRLEDLRWYLVDTGVPMVGASIAEAEVGDETALGAEAGGGAGGGSGASTPTGWHLHLAVEDPAAGWAAAVDAHDTATSVEDETSP